MDAGADADQQAPVSMTVKLREKCSVFVYERGERSVPFVVDEIGLERS